MSIGCFTDIVCPFKSIKLILNCCFAVGLCLLISISNASDYELFKNGRSEYKIIVSKDASESEKWAGQELQKYIKKISGAKLPIQSSYSEDNKKTIIIGFNDFTQKLLGSDVSRPKFNDETCIYKNIGPTIIIYGGSQRGSMYGVFSFLENELGCRWYTPKYEFVPTLKNYSFEKLLFSRKPSIRFRAIHSIGAFEIVWSARNKINSVMNHSLGVANQHGGVDAYWSVHTFYRLLPPSEYFKEHPEYYSLVDGKRIHKKAQLCLTNPDVLKIVSKQILENIKKAPSFQIYSVSQNDNDNPCQCKNCQAIVDREGTQAGPIIWFVNKVAEKVGEKYPDKYIGTLAYKYTRKPPKYLKPAKNVIIRLCSIECDFSHPFNNVNNAKFMADLKNWSKISKQLYLWNYITCFRNYLIPFANLYTIKKNIQILQKEKVIGILQQGNYDGPGSEMLELRNYLLAKLMWDSRLKTDDIINDFVRNYYGSAHAEIRRYITLLHSQIKPSTFMPIWNDYDYPMYSDQFIDKANKILLQAEKKAENDVILKRVQLVRLGILYLKCCKYTSKSAKDGTLDTFKKLTKELGVNYYGEGGKMKVLFERFSKQLKGEK